MGSAWTFRGAAALAVVCAFAAGAAAQEDPTPEPDAPEEPAMDEAQAKAAARKLLDGGDAFLKKGDYYLKRKKPNDATAQYTRALAAYQKAYELVPNPQILFPIAIAEDKLGQYVDAARDYRRFLSQVAEPDPTLKADAEKRLEAVKVHVGVIALQVTPEGAQIAMNGEPLGVAPLPDPLFLDAGNYTLSFTADGYQPLEQTLNVEIGSESERTFELVPIEVKIEIPTEPPPPPPKVALPSPPSKLPLYLGGAVTIGLIGGATVTGILAKGRETQFKDESKSAQAREDARVQGRRLALITDGLIAGTVVAAGVMTFYYFKVYRPKVRGFHDRERAREGGAALTAIPKVQVAPWVQADGGGLIIAGEL